MQTCACPLFPSQVLIPLADTQVSSPRAVCFRGPAHLSSPFRQMRFSLALLVGGAASAGALHSFPSTEQLEDYFLNHDRHNRKLSAAGDAHGATFTYERRRMAHGARHPCKTSVRQPASDRSVPKPTGTTRTRRVEPARAAPTRRRLTTTHGSGSNLDRAPALPVSTVRLGMRPACADRMHPVPVALSRNTAREVLGLRYALTAGC
jgi:hypothetical protein